MGSLRTLKNNGVLYLAADQVASKREIKVPFFGENVPTFRGPVVLHYRTGAPLVPIYSFREDGKNKAVIAEPLNDLTGDLEKDLTFVNKTLERIVCLHPESWFWFHRRWKKKANRYSDSRSPGPYT